MRASRFGKATMFLCSALAALAMVGGGFAVAQESGSGGDKVTVGTFDMRAVFQAYEGSQAFMQQAQQIQQQAQAAQQAGDQQKLRQLQQQFQQAQQQAGAQLQKAVDDVLPKVAESNGCDLVVADVRYTAANVETKSLTDAIIEKINSSEGGGEQAEKTPSE